MHDGATQAAAHKNHADSDDATEEIFGHVLHEDGTSFAFYTERQFQLYLGDSSMAGPLFDTGQLGVAWGCGTEPAAVRMRIIREEEHGRSVFLFHEDFELLKKNYKQIQTSEHLQADVATPPWSFAEAERIATEQAALPVCERRRLGGLTTVTARKSSGLPAPPPPPNFHLRWCKEDAVEEGGSESAEQETDAHASGEEAAAGATLHLEEKATEGSAVKVEELLREVKKRSMDLLADTSCDTFGDLTVHAPLTTWERECKPRPSDEGS